MDYILTNNGAVMMTQVAAGKTLIFTRTEAGSGYSASPAVLQSVVDKKQDMFLDEVTYENKQAVVKSVLSNMQLEEEYQLRQVGVYAKLEGDETDTLVLIGQQYNGEKIPSYHDGIMQIEYNITIKAAGTGNITIEGVGTGYVTKGQFLAHLNDYSNPHKLTAGQIGLGNVPNVDTDDQTPTFMEAEERENIVSGEKLSVIFGKIRKWIDDLKEAAFCLVANNLETMLPGSVMDARQGPIITGLIDDVREDITQLYSEITAPDNTIFIFDYKNGKYGYNTDPERGADTFCPFSEIDKRVIVECLSNGNLGITMDSTPEQIYSVLQNLFPGNIDMAITMSYHAYSNKGTKYVFYAKKYNLTPYKTMTFSISYNLWGKYSGDDKYYYNAWDIMCGVGTSQSGFVKSNGISNLGNQSSQGHHTGTTNITLDVSSLSGDYYVGISLWFKNCYTGGDGSAYSSNPTSSYICSGVVFS